MSQAQLIILAVGIAVAAAWFLLRDRIPGLVQSLASKVEAKAAPVATSASDRDLSIQAFLAVSELIVYGTKTNNAALIEAAHRAGRAMFEQPSQPVLPASPSPPSASV